MNANEMEKVFLVFWLFHRIWKSRIYERFAHENAWQLTWFLLFNCLDFQLKDKTNCVNLESRLFEMSKRVIIKQFDHPRPRFIILNKTSNFSISKPNRHLFNKICYSLSFPL